ncbi:N-acetylmuramoyl-L-alanine amidase precursor [Streptomyces viridochromogenes]|uniref:N-acetylmuramoyl-L-alanine amidase n=1 Tax=Streptomyces viridochromogenes TaxID=1938 RepID=A0A0J8CEF1_STRVR|nr:N-acetylmuramoyl-L-alanine amidase [Streptomyces viridochromogenes]KMS76335.1 N-acetylmuramoyl-L-alanine amidase precursor [Streptomyces viridochromogenes]KOG20448.1 N-acetylmuramoyl-L-alanine amidase precursor [Streptomyces viridochromogenes]KOG22291.1 N-acetylmuramoyl-L-alanine amidase precursor [Streptomyces viridochromogenes]
MKLVTRAQLGWPSSAAPTQTSTKGVKVHYEGATVSVKLLDDHDLCIDKWKAIRKDHLANPKENYSDIAYNYGACPHGHLLEGRGLGRRTGANGNQELNRAHYAICGLVGSKGLTKPNDAMLGAIRDGIELLRRHGAGKEIKGHRDGLATACPGEHLYAWVRKGAPRPGDSPSVPGPRPVVDLSKVIAAALHDPDRPGTPVSYAGVRTVEKALVAEGLLDAEYADGHFGGATVKAYSAWQHRCGFTGADANGIPGQVSLDRLGAAHDFDVRP